MNNWRTERKEEERIKIKNKRTNRMIFLELILGSLLLIEIFGLTKVIAAGILIIGVIFAIIIAGFYSEEKSYDNYPSFYY